MYYEQKAVIINDISVVSNIKLYQIHCRLCEIFSFWLDIALAGLTVILLGDLHQLPLVQGKSSCTLSGRFNEFTSPLWTFQLTEVMWQKGDSIFVGLLNNVRAGAVSEIDIALIASRSCAIINLSSPVDAIYLFSENGLKDNFNNKRLLKPNYPLIEVPSLDKNDSGVSNSNLATVPNHRQSQTGYLAKLFRFKKNNSVMLTTNVSIMDS